MPRGDDSSERRGLWFVGASHRHAGVGALRFASHTLQAGAAQWHAETCLIHSLGLAAGWFFKVEVERLAAGLDLDGRAVAGGIRRDANDWWRRGGLLRLGRFGEVFGGEDFGRVFDGANLHRFGSRRDVGDRVVASRNRSSD